MIEQHEPPQWLRPTVAILVVLLLGLHIMTRDDSVGYGYDSAQYMRHAENIAEGNDYADTGYIQNADRQMDPVYYPPGYPLVLAPVVAVWGSGRAPVAVLQAVFLVTAVWMFAAVYWRELSPALVVGLTLLLGLNPYLWEMVNKGYSDLLFLSVVAFAVLAVNRIGSVQGTRAAWGWAVAAGGACAAALLIRVLGVALLPALLVPLLRSPRRRRVPLVAAALSIAVVIPVVVMEFGEWEAGAQIITGTRTGGGYGQLVTEGFLRELARLPPRIMIRAFHYARMDGWVLWDRITLSPWIDAGARLAGLAVLVIGVARRVRQPRAVDVFGAAYAAALLPWSFGQTRYLVPLVPVIYGTILTGVEVLWGWARNVDLRRRVVAYGLIGNLLVVLVGFVAQSLAAVPERLGDEAVQLDDRFRLLLEHTPSTAVVLTSDDPRPTTFFARRTASRLPGDTTAWDAYGRRIGATHALLLSPNRGVEKVASDFGWRLVARGDDCDLYATRASERADSERVP
jgi:hypothetical protein